MKKKNSVVQKERDSKDTEVYKAEFVEEIPANRVEKRSEAKPLFPTAVRVIGKLGSLALFLIKASDLFRKNIDDNKGKNRVRLRKRRKR